MNRTIFIIFIFSGLYAQCSEMNESQCNNNEYCSWVEDINNIDCDDLSDYNSCSLNY